MVFKNLFPLSAGSRFTHQSDTGVYESSSGDDGQKSDKLVRVLLKLEVDRSREHDGPDQLALRGAEPSSKNNGKNAMSSVVSGLRIFKKFHANTINDNQGNVNKCQRWVNKLRNV